MSHNPSLGSASGAADSHVTHRGTQSSNGRRRREAANAKRRNHPRLRFSVTSYGLRMRNRGEKEMAGRRGLRRLLPRLLRRRGAAAAAAGGVITSASTAASQDDRRPSGKGGGVPGSKAARRAFGVLWPLGLFFIGSRQKPVRENEVEVYKSPEEWKRELPPEAAKVIVDRGTEYAFSSDLYTEQRAGEYECRACGAALYRSEDKFDSGTGWPSFTKAVSANAVKKTLQPIYLLGDLSCREVRCTRCGAHLGHVFGDGPAPTGKRHCINGVSLSFVPKQAETKAEL